MSTRLKEKEERILHVLEFLAEESAKGIPIIVEGKKDIKALRDLAIGGKIVSAKSGGKRFLDIVSEIEKAGSREVILLLDFDRRGKELTANLKQYLEKTGIKSNLLFWRELSMLVSREVKDVEGLTAYMETLKRKVSVRSN